MRHIVQSNIVTKYPKFLCLFKLLLAVRYDWGRAAVLAPGVIHHLPRHGAVPQLPHPARQANTIRDAALWIQSG